MFVSSELLSYRVVAALSISRNLNCEELDPYDEDRVIRAELLGDISAKQRSKCVIFHFVELLDEHAPLILSFGAFQISFLVEQIDSHIGKHLSEGGVDDVVEGAQFEAAGVWNGHDYVVVSKSTISWSRDIYQLSRGDWSKSRCAQRLASPKALPTSYRSRIHQRVCWVYPTTP